MMDGVKNSAFLFLFYPAAHAGARHLRIYHCSYCVKCEAGVEEQVRIFKGENERKIKKKGRDRCGAEGRKERPFMVSRR